MQNKSTKNKQWYDTFNTRVQRRYNKMRKKDPNGWKWAPLPHGWKAMVRAAKTAALANQAKPATN